jgi:uncharacterized membrane protein
MCRVASSASLLFPLFIALFKRLSILHCFRRHVSTFVTHATAMASSGNVASHAKDYASLFSCIGPHFSSAIVPIYAVALVGRDDK